MGETHLTTGGEMSKTLATEQVALQLTATDLAWLAETADGNRSVDFVLVRDANGKAQLRAKDSMQEGDEVPAEIKVRTEQTLPDRTKVVQVTCQAEGHDLEPLLSADAWDAVFWTESSVEKFLYPYYRSQRLWDSRMDALQARYNSDPEAVAIAHRAPSYSQILDAKAAHTIAIGKVVRNKAAAKPAAHWKPIEHYLAEK
jgi:hypothetical protein